MISHEAKVCRRSCHVKSLISGRLERCVKPVLDVLTGSPALRPVACANTYGQSGMRWLYSACSVVSTVALSGSDGVGHFSSAECEHAVQKVH